MNPIAKAAGSEPPTTPDAWAAAPPAKPAIRQLETNNRDIIAASHRCIAASHRGDYTKRL
jgi:hypothetical protein